MDLLGWMDRTRQRRRWLAYPYAIFRKFGDDQAGYRAALLAHYGFLSVLPLLLTLTTVLGYVLKNNPSVAARTLDRWRMRNARPGLYRWTVSVPALSFVVALSVARALLAAAAPPAPDMVAGLGSTSVVNLLLHPVGALVASVFVGSGDLLLWCILGTLGLVITAWRFGGGKPSCSPRRPHDGTYLSEGLLALRVLMHERPASDLRIEEFGPSYVVASALGVGIVFGPTGGRLGCAVAFLGIAPELFGSLTSLDMTAVGHLCAVLAGVTLAFVLRHYQQRTDP